MVSSACHTLTGHAILFLYLFFFLSYFNNASSRPLGIASPNFQERRIVGWDRTSFFDFRLSIVGLHCLGFTKLIPTILHHVGSESEVLFRDSSWHGLID